MKRMHLHVGVENLDQSVRFYSALFGTQPTRTKTDYAQWLLEEPRLNFAISTRVGTKGVDHLGLQVDDPEELAELRERFSQADLAVYDEGEVVCCYSRSDKAWIKDPSGVAWEAYRTMEQAQVYSSVTEPKAEACCVPGAHVQAGSKATAAVTTGCC